MMRYIITSVVFIALVALFAAYQLRFHNEEKTVRHFVDTIVAGNMDDAYRIWKPTATYSFKDFLEGWGPTGSYGPIKSYRIEHVERMAAASGGDASGAGATVTRSPSPPLPYSRD